MMSNKRGSEEISGVIQHTPQSENSTPKRAKLSSMLDVLAMAAELSDQNDKAAQVATAIMEQAPVQAPKSELASLPVKKPASAAKAEAPKSSFAAWKLAKGRKNGSKSPNGQDTLKDNSSGTAGVFAKDLPSAAVLEAQAAAVIGESPQIMNPLVAVAAAAAPMPVATLPTARVQAAEGLLSAMSAASLPPKKAMKNKNPSSKNIVSSKKTVKKDKDGMPIKKKKGDKSNGSSKASGKSKTKKGDASNPKTSSFPEKIMEILLGGLAPSAIYWLPEGEAIAVDPDSFKDNTIISKQFRGNKLSSFVRSLNRWGFRRIFYHSLPDKTLAFYHRLFQKQAPALVKEMKMDGGEKEPELPRGAMATAPASTAVVTDTKPPAAVEAPSKKSDSPVAALPAAPSAATQPPLPTLVESARASPQMSASSPALQAMQAAVEAAGIPAPAPPAVHAEQVLSAAVAALPKPVASPSILERSALELAQGQQALQLQQTMVAEQERSDLALQSLQAQQLVLQSLADQQNVAQAEELLMQSMLAEQQRSEMALQQRQAEQALLQQMLAEQETAALAAALGGGGAAGGLNADALLRDRLLLQQLGANPALAPGGSDVLALSQHQLQGGQQPHAREPSYMELLLLLEQQQQQQQRQQEAALLAARGFHFG